MKVHKSPKRQIWVGVQGECVMSDGNHDCKERMRFEMRTSEDDFAFSTDRDLMPKSYRASEVLQSHVAVSPVEGKER